MKSAFDRDPEKIVAARERHVESLQRALVHAEDLARQERTVIPEVGEQGVFQQLVEVPLREITQGRAASAR